MTRFAERNSTSQRLGLLGVLVLLLGLVLPFAPAAEATHPLGTPEDVTTERFAGADRFDTAGIIADDGFGTSTDVLLARGDLFPDALSGNFLAGIRGVPIVLMPHDHLDQDTMDALEDLGAENITILGQTAAISADNEQRLEDEGYNVDRVGGIDRYETSKLTGEEGAEEGTVGTWNGQRTAIVPSGENFPDALVAGALAYSEDLPVLLTHPSALPDFTRQALGNLDIEHAIIPGGVVAVSQDVEDQINAMGIETTRVFGQNRVTTATEFANFVKAEFGWTYDTVNLARGDEFPDALTIGPHAGEAEAPILLTHNPDALGSTTHDDGRMETEPWLRDNACEILAMHFAGGVFAISDATADQAEAAAEDAQDCPAEPAAAVATLSAEHVGAAVNQVGDDHSVLANADDSDGDDATGADIRFEVTRDGSAITTGSDETDANGNATFTYTNDTAGDDTITVCANSDGSLPADCADADLTQTLTKTWTEEEPLVAFSVDATPEEDTNVVGDVHTVDASVQDQNGDLLEGATVRFDVSGTHTASGSDTTDTNGHADFSYEGTATGNDTIFVWADLNGDGNFDDGEPSDEVVKTWEIGDPASIQLLPEDDVNPVGTTHTMYSIVRDRNGNPVPNVSVGFEVTGTVAEAASDTTDPSGVAEFTYSSNTEGDDIITSCVNVDGSDPLDPVPTCDSADFTDTATKTWQERVATTLDLEPENAVNEVGSDHTVVATVEDQFGAPIENVTVLFEVTGTSNATPDTDTGTTGSDGQTTFTYTSTIEGEDTIAACTTQDGNPPAGGCEFEDPAQDDNTDLEDTVLKTWESTPQQLALDSDEATNTVGDQHMVTATVTDGADQPVEDAVVRFEVDDQFEATATTDSSGQATFQYSTTTAGDDTIEACTTEDGTTPDDCPTTDALTDSQIKHWLAGPAFALDLEPEEATNTVGTEHTVTATVTDEHGNPVSGEDVTFEVDGVLSGADTTGSDGTATFTYTNTAAEDDVIEACLTATCDGEAVGEDDNTDLNDAVLKHWEADDPATLAFTQDEVTNTGTTAGDQHQVTVTVTDEHGNAVQGAMVQFEVTGVSGEETAELVMTDSNGQATFTYTNESGDTGDDQVTACTDPDGSDPEGECPDPSTSDLSDRQIKHWT